MRGKVFKILILALIVLSCMNSFMPQQAYASGGADDEPNFMERLYAGIGSSIVSALNIPTPGELLDLCFVDEFRIPTETLGLLPIYGPIMKPYSISGNIVRCIQTFINFQGMILTGMYLWFFGPFLYIAGTMGMLFFGLKMMYGTIKSPGQAMSFVLKMMFILFCAKIFNVVQLVQLRDGLFDFSMNMSGEIFEDVGAPFYAGEVSTEALAQQLPSVLDNIGNNKEVIDPQYDDIFDKLDRYVMAMWGVDKRILVANLYGNFDVVKSQKEYKPRNFIIGVAALITGLFVSGAMGSLVAGILFIYAVTIVFAVAQAVMFFIMIMIAINFLVAITPVAAICLLFKPTQRIATTWFMYLIIYSVQPIIFVAFMAFSFSVMGSVVMAEKPADYLTALIEVDGQELDTCHGIFGKFTCRDKLTKVVNSAEAKEAGGEMEEVVLFDCDSPTFRSAFEKLGEGLAGGISTKSQIANFTMGESSAFSNFTKSVNHFLDNANCKISVKQFEIDAFDDDVEQLKEGNFLKSSSLTEEDLKQITGQALGLIIYMVIMISFLRKLPSLIDDLVSSGGIMVPPIIDKAEQITGRVSALMVGGRGDGTATQGVFGGGIMGVIKKMNPDLGKKSKRK